MPSCEDPNTQQHFEQSNCFCSNTRICSTKNFPNNHTVPGNSIENLAVEAVKYPNRSNQDLRSDFPARAQAQISSELPTTVASRN